MQASFSFPSHRQLDIFIKKELPKKFTYPEVGATAIDKYFAHYDNDHNYKVIGTGMEVWEKAKKAIKNWQHFPLPWTKIYPSNAPLQKEVVVVVLFRLFGLWWRNSARIVYTFDEPDRFGFAYGTLPGHVEVGEEVFWIEKDVKGVVSYHIKAFSRPKFWMAKIAYPIARMYQRKFVKESIETMKKLCE